MADGDCCDCCIPLLDGVLVSGTDGVESGTITAFLVSSYSKKA